MKISTKGRYAVRLMLDIALNQDVEPVRLKDSAERQDISVKYLEQIISVLVKAGYVRSIRGPQGGYKLAKAPSEYTVKMVLTQVEGSLAPVSCLDDEVNTCERQGNCVTLKLWTELYDAINGVLEKYTIADLMEWSKNIGFDYVI